MDATIAAAHAATTPAYVRANGDGWQVIDSATGEVRCRSAGLLEALDLAAKTIADKRDASGQPVRVMRGDDHEPNGAWRYLPASSAEDEPNPQDGVRLTEQSIWQMASGLNARSQPIGIDGGPGSVVHGLAHDSSTPINGAAHRGLVVYDYEDRAGLYLQAEIVPDVARLIDRGQLAWGSCHFWTSEDLDETGAPEDAGLISYGLTNTPADSRIVPANAARAAAAALSTHARVASRTRQLLRAAPLATERSMDGMYPKKLWLEAINAASAKELSPDQVCEIIKGLAAQSAKPTDAPAPDKQLEMEMATPPAPPPERAAEPPAVRAIAGLEDPAALETFASGCIDALRKVFAKPDADPAALLAELQAQQDKLAGALGAAPPTPDNGTPADAKGAEMAQPPSPAERALDEEAARCREAFGKKDADPATLLAHARGLIQRSDDERWLAKEIADRKLAITEAERAEYLNDIAAHGRPLMLRTLARMARPPSGVVMRNELPLEAPPETLREAIDSCMSDAAKLLPADAALHVVRAQAQKLAIKHWPSLGQQPEAS